ncbi:hypothetical protein GSI_02734 [Ganoderma sinense ZZ0214-1]|uniref:F-box domain-containing protein n=1 Tax=Ganoderma sinense ZZ0214-1 TaxID=1077348 RepID=A0A2G8SMF0_9APHY|nr:hypothetical protein GSI_02734 [Ganoderma sinense ZZ0214-1]
MEPDELECNPVLFELEGGGCRDRSAQIHDLPTEVLLLIFWRLHGQDIARCMRVSRAFADLTSSDVYLQYRIELAKNGMIDGPSSTLPVSERLQRLRRYSSNFRNGIFDHEDITAHPDYAQEFRSLHWNSRTIAEGVTSVGYYMDNHRCFISVLMDGSSQAGIPSRRLIIRIPSDQTRSTTGWIIDRSQDLFLTVECVGIGTNQRFFEIHFRSWSSSQMDHPAATLPCIQVFPPPGAFNSLEERIHVYSPIAVGCHVIWKLLASVGPVWNHSIHVCNWKSGQIIVGIDLGATDQTFVELDDAFILVLPRHSDSGSEPHLRVYSLSPSASSHPLCFLQLPPLILSPGDRVVARCVGTSRQPPIPEGHFQADPSMSMIVISHSIESEATRPSPCRISKLLIPCTALLNQIRLVVDSDPASLGPPVLVPWQDWGPSASLRLLVPVHPHPDDFGNSIAMVPYGSRLPIVAFDDPVGHARASVYVIDINPLTARHARLALAAQSESGARTTATAIVEDVEAALPGVVDPEIKGIPFVVYRFELPPLRPNWPMIRAVRMSMTGFTVTYGNDGPELNDESWTV